MLGHVSVAVVYRGIARTIRYVTLRCSVGHETHRRNAMMCRYIRVSEYKEDSVNVRRSLRVEFHCHSLGLSLHIIHACRRERSIMTNCGNYAKNNDLLDLREDP